MSPPPALSPAPYRVSGIRPHARPRRAPWWPPLSRAMLVGYLLTSLVCVGLGEPPRSAAFRIVAATVLLSLAVLVRGLYRRLRVRARLRRAPLPARRPLCATCGCDYCPMQGPPA